VGGVLCFVDPNIFAMGGMTTVGKVMVSGLVGISVLISVYYLYLIGVEGSVCAMGEVDAEIGQFLTNCCQVRVGTTVIVRYLSSVFVDCLRLLIGPVSPLGCILVYWYIETVVPSISSLVVASGVEPIINVGVMIAVRERPVALCLSLVEISLLRTSSCPVRRWVD